MKYKKSRRTGDLATRHVKSMFDRVLEHKHNGTFNNRAHLIYLLKQTTLYTIGSSITLVVQQLQFWGVADKFFAVYTKIP
jgi:hypothetical protein